MAATTGRQPTDRSLDRGAQYVLRARRPAAEALPAPETEWERHEVPDILSQNLPTFRTKGIVTVVRTHRRHGNTPVQVYRTTAPAYAYVESLDAPPTPCDHTGVRTMDADAGVYTCCHDHCDATFGRATAREVLDR